MDLFETAELSNAHYSALRRGLRIGQPVDYQLADQTADPDLNALFAKVQKTKTSHNIALLLNYKLVDVACWVQSVNEGTLVTPLGKRRGSLPVKHLYKLVRNP